MDYMKGNKENMHSPVQLPSVFQDEDDSERQTEGSNRTPSEYEYFDSAMIMEEGEGYADGPRLQTSNQDHYTDGLRSGQRLNRADPAHVEYHPDDDDPNMSKTKEEKIKMNHIVNIFIDDKKLMEVSPQQLHRVRTMHKKIDDGASFSFNYNTLLIVASIIAGLGLVSNSSAIIIASMLVSPLMGPVVGLAYGTTINDWKLVRKSFKTECISLLVCIVVGNLIGSVTAPTRISDDWPTQEMAARGTAENFVVALPIAFVSGLGVAVSLLDDQTSSLVGVAISASLLPPAVNAGIMWIAVIFVESDVITPTTCYKNTTENFNASQEYLKDVTDDDDLFDGEGKLINCTKWLNGSDAVDDLVNTTLWLEATESENASDSERIQCLEWFNITDDAVNSTGLMSSLEPVQEQGVRYLQKIPFEDWADDTSDPEPITPDDLCTEQDQTEHNDEFYMAATISLMLTLANILLIWLSGMFMFRMKEVLPIKKTVFWEDLGIARCVYTHRAVLSTENFVMRTKTDDNDEKDDDDDEEKASSRI